MKRGLLLFVIISLMLITSVTAKEDQWVNLGDETFKVSSDWQFEEWRSSVGIGYRNVKHPHDEFTFIIWPYPAKDYEDFAQFVDMRKGVYRDYAVIIEHKKMLLNNLKAECKLYRIFAEDSDEKKILVYYICGKNCYYIITMSYRKGLIDFDKHRKEFEEIISTFKTTDKDGNDGANDDRF